MAFIHCLSSMAKALRSAFFGRCPNSVLPGLAKSTHPPPPPLLYSNSSCVPQHSACAINHNVPRLLLPDETQVLILFRGIEGLRPALKSPSVGSAAFSWRSPKPDSLILYVLGLCSLGLLGWASDVHQHVGVPAFKFVGVVLAEGEWPRSAVIRSAVSIPVVSFDCSCKVVICDRTHIVGAPYLINRSFNPTGLTVSHYSRPDPVGDVIPRHWSFLFAPSPARLLEEKVEFAPHEPDYGNGNPPLS